MVDDKGTVALSSAVATDPETIGEVLRPYAGRLRRVGHEAGSLSPWLHPELVTQGLPAGCLETRHVRAAMSAQRNKTDAADALGIAHIMRTGWFRQAHVKTQSCHRIRLLLSQRRNLKREAGPGAAAPARRGDGAALRPRRGAHERRHDPTQLRRRRDRPPPALAAAAPRPLIVTRFSRRPVASADGSSPASLVN